MIPAISIAKDVEAALSAGRPVVALESALITHGFAYPANVQITRQMCESVRQEGAYPAVIGIWEGKPLVGLTSQQIERLGQHGASYKVSVRDLPLCTLRGGFGGTTVAATATLAAGVGIRVFATGGIGGVHRDHPEDVSADLPVLASTPIVVVCSGAKSILDLPKTLEYLETHGVPVLGWQTDEFPAFYSRRSGLRVDWQVRSADEVVKAFQGQRALGLPQATLVTVPVPATSEVPAHEAEPWLSQALAEATAQSIGGKDLTPFLLERLVALSHGRTRQANEALLTNKARVAAQIAVSLADQAARFTV